MFSFYLIFDLSQGKVAQNYLYFFRYFDLSQGIE